MTEHEDMTHRLSRLEKENSRLRVAVEELSVLNEIATAIASTLSLDRIVDLIVQKCVKHMDGEQGAVMLLEEQDTRHPFRTMVRKADTVASVLPYRLGSQLTGWMLKNKKPLLSNDLESDGRFQMKEDEDLPIRSLLSVPLLQKGRMIGILTVFNNKTDQGFTSNDQRLLSIISAQSAQVIENARLYKKEQFLTRMQEEMRMAEKIQMNLLPGIPPDIAGYDIAGTSLPAKNVGGDYFDYILADEGHCAFCIGDVSGKGMPAALLMANLQAAVRGQTHLKASTEDCMMLSNNLLFQSTAENKFATFFYSILDTQTHEISYSNAGHNPPLLFPEKGEPTPLKTGGVVLGFMENFSYQHSRCPFSRGDLLLLFSDGITEAVNAAGEEFGEERLKEVIVENRNDSAEELVDKIIRTAKYHEGDQPQMDDMTALIVKREG
jgi:serine phosphatase RsbU (regulator of sigma subunit)